MQEHYPFPTSIRIGDWMLDSATGLLTRDGKMARLEVHTLRLLLRLAQEPGVTVSVEELLKEVWPGGDVTPDAVHEAVGDLRIALGDDPLRPRIIAAVRRKGYRLNEEGDAAPARRKIPARWWQAGAALVLVAAATAALLLRPAPEIPRTVGVMPFIDLTDAVARDPFATTVTEQMIGRLTKVPGLGVSPPAASMRFRDNPVAFGEFANALQVAYVVDGSMRKARGTLTFAARLTRASDGEVILTRSFERPWEEREAILDEVAAEIGATITTPPKK